MLEHLQAHFPEQPVCYWRNKAGREVDFVRTRGRDEVDVIECKWDAGAFDRDSVEAFRSYYPKGHNYLVTPSAEPACTRRYGRLEVRICTPPEIRA